MDDLRHSFTQTLPFDEFRVWEQRVRPKLVDAGIERACIDVLEYVCTEMLNNVLDHSGASLAELAYDWNPNSVAMRISDDGRGAFAVLREAHRLDTDIDAALLVLKGRVTSDPARHTGEGLFFASRACDWMSLQAGRVGLSLSRQEGHWAYEARNEAVQGTRLRFRVSRLAPPRLADLFERFCPQPELRFTRTEVSVGLLLQTDGALVSRSQGGRLVRGLENFTAVDFDFSGVETMQQGFADEVFRVWRKAHPGVAVSVSHAAEGVVRMLARVGFAS